MARLFRCAGLVVALFAGRSLAAPDCQFDHSHQRWNELLTGFVKGGVVDYAGLKKAPAALEAYLAELSSICPAAYAAWSKPQKVALWVNAYNAWTIKTVLDHYPLASIKEIGLLPGAAWRDRFIPMASLRGGRGNLSLNDLEHEILRKDFPDARLHFALVCASKSCPELRSEAYRAEQLEAQLDDAGRRFLADPSKNAWDAATKTWHVSSIFKWYASDFERDGPGLVPFLKRFAAEVGTTQPTLDYLTYDWTLNGR